MCETAFSWQNNHIEVECSFVQGIESKFVASGNPADILVLLVSLSLGTVQLNQTRKDLVGREFGET